MSSIGDQINSQSPGKRPGVKYITALPTDEKCVGMVTFEGSVLIATDRGVYRLSDNKLVPIEFEVPDK